MEQFDFEVFRGNQIQYCPYCDDAHEVRDGCESVILEWSSNGRYVVEDIDDLYLMPEHYFNVELDESEILEKAETAKEFGWGTFNVYLPIYVAELDNFIEKIEKLVPGSRFWSRTSDEMGMIFTIE